MTKTIDLNVSGMTCQACAGKVRGALEKTPGVASADVDHATGQVSVHTDGTVDTDDLAFTIDEAIEAVGYRVEES